jgi:alkyl hydroperoxide reductase subunit F
MYDLIIIGGGPAGCAAGVYAARKQLKTLLVTTEFGGQSIVSPEIYNWIGDQKISGDALAKKLESHVRSYESDDCLNIIEAAAALDIQKSADHFELSYEKNGEQLVATAKTILIASGSRRRQLSVPGASEFEHKGVVYCASCDGPLFSGLDVAVVGGGNAGFESAAQLLAYANSVTLLHRRDEYKADKITVDRVLSNPNMTGILNAEPTAVLGDNFVSGLKYRDKKTDTEHVLNVMGVFVEIGAVPNTEYAKHVVELDPAGYIQIDPWTQKTDTEGIWAAGDCTNVKYHQNNIAAGDAVKAVEDIYYYLNT